MKPEGGDLLGDSFWKQWTGLTVHDLDECRCAKLCVAAQAELARHRRFSNTFSRVYSCYLEPVMVGGTSLAVLTWTVLQLNWLLGN